MKAVIDIGTNTINLLIARKEGNSFQTELFERIPAKLGQGGMSENRLTDDAIYRGLHALGDHLATCDEFGVDEVRITATSAVRSAINKADFIDAVSNEFMVDIEVIDGDREAELIWKGVRHTGLIQEQPSLIMDIGGGSTEFILAQGDKVIWQESYDLGVTRLKERFEASDPMQEEEMRAVKDAIREQLEDLWLESSGLKIEKLIGASGSFNSIDLMLTLGDIESLPSIKHNLDITGYRRLSQKIRSSNYTERSIIPGLVADRVDTIAYSILLIDVVIETLQIENLWRSSYALKEGLMGEMFSLEL